MKFCDVLKELRKERGLTAQGLASMLGYSKNIVYEWEHGRCEPSFEVLCKIAKLFDVSVDYLIGNSEDYHVPASAPTAPTLSHRDRELLDAFYMLDVYQQDFFFRQIKATAGENQLIKK